MDLQVSPICDLIYAAAPQIVHGWDKTLQDHMH